MHLFFLEKTRKNLHYILVWSSCMKKIFFSPSEVSNLFYKMFVVGVADFNCVPEIFFWYTDPIIFKSVFNMYL